MDAIKLSSTPLPLTKVRRRVVYLRHYLVVCSRSSSFLLSLPLPPHSQHVFDEVDGHLGEVEAVEDVVVLHDGL